MGDEGRVETLILGAGPTGLGAAYRLKELGKRNFLVLEQNNAVGGLARTLRDDHGFYWDIGGHVQFSHYAYFDRVMDSQLSPSQWLQHRRKSAVWMDYAVVPYPFQNNLRHLPDLSLGECVDGLRDAQLKETFPRNFKEWMLSSFGSGICRHFMYPYNQKVWAIPPERMSYSWIADRVASIDLQETLSRIAEKRDDTEWGPNAHFRFPHRGGTGAIWEAVADSVGRGKIRLNRTVVKIDPQRRQVTCSDGSQIGYRHLLTTIPLDVSTAMVEGLNADVSQQAQRLQKTKTHIFGLGMTGQCLHSRLAEFCWLYFPQESVPFYRVTVFSKYAPANVPDPSSQWSLLFEVAESSYFPQSKGDLFQRVEQAALDQGLIESRKTILSRWQMEVPHGYPVPTVERDEILEIVQPALSRLGLDSRGRFGGWKYEVSNQDHSFMQGVEWADKIVVGGRETTYWNPAGVKGKKKPAPSEAALVPLE